MEVVTSDRKFPEPGELVLLCTHLAAEPPGPKMRIFDLHPHDCGEPSCNGMRKFVRPDGSIGSAKWMGTCESCFAVLVGARDGAVEPGGEFVVPKHGLDIVEGASA